MLCGPSGCGKSTRLRQLKTVLAPHGHRKGEILFEGRRWMAWTSGPRAGRIGFVLQKPGKPMVTDKVWHELAFGLERAWVTTRPPSGGGWRRWPPFFGIQTWFYKNVTELSGGQKQL